MKRCSIFLLFLLVLLYSSRAVSQDPAFPQNDRKVTTVYDNKTDTTAVRFGPMLLIYKEWQEGELSLTAFFTYKGKTFVRPESVALLFHSINLPTDRWELSQHKDLEITADDNHWKIPNVELVDSKHAINADLVNESLGVSVPCEIFAKIANAKKGEVATGR